MISKCEVPQEHWFRMGRQLTAVDGGRALISWTGTMFEYLMPLLVMRSYRETLLGETYAAVVSRQIEYGYERGVPWGISESAYAARDLQLNYQYGPFGVPGLGLKRGLIEDLVVSPYSTILAANVLPAPAMENLRVLEREGGASPYRCGQPHLRYRRSANSAHPVVIEWNLQRDDHDCGRGLFDVRTAGGEPLARRLNPRRLGQLRLHPRRTQRRRVVGR